MKSVDPASLSRSESYRLMIGCVVPRPIGWISTVSGAGVTNAAPFSYFGGVSSDPPTISVSVGRRNGVQKDTWLNIEQTGEFVVNVVTEALGAAMARTSGDFPSGVSEFKEAGLTAVPSLRVRPPRIGESPVQMECRAVKIIEVGRGPDGLILGEIVQFHMSESVLTDGAVDPSKLHALGRLGGSLYCKTTDLIVHERPRISTA